MTTDTAHSSRVDLAKEDDFWIGQLHISPSRARVSSDDDEHRVEPRVMEVLIVLFRQAGQTITRDQLIEACWGGRVVSDDAVNRVIAQVRGLARLRTPAPFVLETVPKVGVRLISNGDSASKAMNASRMDPPPGRPPRPWVRLATTIVLVAGLTLGGALGWRMVHPSLPSAQNGRVEVMRFEARSSNAAVQEAAADIPRDLIRVLVAGGVEASPEPRRLDDAGNDAELRITGDVGLENGRYVITSQIIDRRSGIVLWAERIERSPEQNARSPGAFAAQVAGVLDCMLKDRQRARAPLATVAVGLYLNACAGVFFQEDQGELMLAASRQLVKAAPHFGGAHAMHAIGAALLASGVTTPAGAAALHAEAKTAAETALKLDPGAAKAYFALAVNEGLWLDRIEHNWFAEEHYLLAALDHDPELAPARIGYAALLRATGRFTEAVEFMKVSVAAKDPRIGADPRLPMVVAAQGDLADAEALLSRIEARDRISQRNMRVTIAFWWDNPVRGLAAVKALAGEETPEPQACLEAYLSGLIRHPAGGLRGLPAACDAGLDRGWRVRMLAREGDIDGAYAALQGEISGGSILFFYPETRGMRADPRFWPLMKRIGLIDYWRRSGHWPDFCTEPGAVVDCRAQAARVASLGATAESARIGPHPAAFETLARSLDMKASRRRPMGVHEA